MIEFIAKLPLRENEGVLPTANATMDNDALEKGM
jgi:hypothetical protein